MPLDGGEQTVPGSRVQLLVIFICPWIEPVTYQNTYGWIESLKMPCLSDKSQQSWRCQTGGYTCEKGHHYGALFQGHPGILAQGWNPTKEVMVPHRLNCPLCWEERA